MTVMNWVGVGALLASILFVGLGFAAFWPEWPPIEPGVHRATKDKPVAKPVIESPPTEILYRPTVEEAVRPADIPRPRHRFRNVGEETRAWNPRDIPWPERQPPPRPFDR